jgi:hypothetical protein
LPRLSARGKCECSVDHRAIRHSRMGSPAAGAGKRNAGECPGNPHSCPEPLWKLSWSPHQTLGKRQISQKASPTGQKLGDGPPNPGKAPEDPPGTPLRTARNPELKKTGSLRFPRTPDIMNGLLRHDLPSRKSKASQGFVGGPKNAQRHYREDWGFSGRSPGLLSPRRMGDNCSRTVGHIVRRHPMLSN